MFTNYTKVHDFSMILGTKNKGVSHGTSASVQYFLHTSLKFMCKIEKILQIS